MDVFSGTSDSMHELTWDTDPSVSLTRPAPPSPSLHLSVDQSLSDMDLLFKIISEHREQPVSSLPRPNSPLSISKPSGCQQVKLVARGSACPAVYSFEQPLSASSRAMMSNPPPCSQESPGTELLERVLERPTLVVVEEPKDRGMRFRYECEGRSAGSILGASSTDSSKTQPAIEIQGPIDHIKKVKVTVSLVTKDIPHRPHPHCLVGKDCPHGSGICVISFNPHSTRRHSFANLGIQCVRRKELEASLQKRRSQNIDPFQTGHSKGIEDIDMNAVRLCFQCELEWDDGKKDCLKPVVSKPIYDKKATTTSQLKITRLNLDRGPCTGKTEVYMLCDKVQKDDIEIIFRQDAWKANGEFAQTDVHRQVGIVFKTPPYQDQGITEAVDVDLCLRRISDQMESEPVTFTYVPRNPDPYEVKRKRKIKSDMSFTERPCTSETISAADSFQISANTAQPAESTGELLHPVVPGPFQGEACYMEPHCSNIATEDFSLINQLLEMPGFMDILSDPSFSSTLPPGFEQGPDASTAFTNMDMNTAPYFQDFSHYNDLQFNMLVNENQTASSESSLPMVQVKTEDDVC